MELNIDNLKEVNAFTGAPVEREIKWNSNGEKYTATVYVRTLSYISAVSDIKSLRDGTDLVAGKIAACICDKKGKPIFSAADITGDADPDRGPLDGNLAMALLDVIGEVNGLGKSKS